MPRPDPNVSFAVRSDGTKVCSRCGIEKPRIDFNTHKRSLDGRNGVCRACMNGPTGHYQRNREARLAYQKERNRSNPQYSLAVSRRLKYGVSFEWMETQRVSQGNVCAVCGQPPGKRDLHLDHDHVTGQVREFLCHGCNAALGMVHDSEERLSLLIEYLRRHRGT